MDSKQTEIGSIPNHWGIKPLPDVLSFIVDNRGKTVPTSDKGIALIATNCIVENALYPVKEKIRFITQETYDTWFRSHPKPNDIIFVNKGTPGQVCIVPNPVDFCIAQDMVAIRPNEAEIDWKFLFAYLRSGGFKKQVQGLNVGTTIPHLKKSVFNQLKIPIPSRKEQEIIGDSYYSLSAKIEFNVQMNRTLEQIAQATFKHWFVDFQFPDFDGELLDGLPKGWRIGKLGEVLELAYGKALKSETRVEGKYPVIGSSGVVGCHNEYYVEGAGIVIGRKGTIGEVIWIDENFFPIDTTFFVKDLVGVKDLFFHFYLLQKQNFKNIASDSAVPGLNRNQAMQNEIIIPDKKVILQFNEIIKPIFEKKSLLKNENQILTQIRNGLLPKLMSGKIRVAE